MRAFYQEPFRELRADLLEEMHFPPHLHAAAEFFYVERGRLEVSAGPLQRELGEGELAVLFPNTVHSYRALGGENLFYMVICPLDDTGNYREDLLRFHPKNPFLSREELHPDVAYALRRLEEQQRLGPDRPVCCALIQLVLARVFPLLELERNTARLHLDLTSRIAGYIAEHFREPLSLEQIARALGVSKYYLSHVFSERFQTNFNHYVNSLRLEFARELLCSGDGEILSIGLECGFNSQRTFNRAFKEAFNMTPQQYRNQWGRAPREGEHPECREKERRPGT